MRAYDDNYGGAAGGQNPDQRGAWTFLTNHTHVLLCIARDATVRLRDVAVTVGITERAAQSIVADLVNEGYLSRTRVGRRNEYEIHTDRPLRHTSTAGVTVGGFLEFLQREVDFVPMRINAMSTNGNGYATNGNGYHGNN
jgi:hypothetical protein